MIRRNLYEEYYLLGVMVWFEISRQGLIELFVFWQFCDWIH